MIKKVSAGGLLKDKKKIFTLLFAAIVVILFAAFLLSLTEEEKTPAQSVASDKVTGELVINQDAVNEPAAKRYDYNNVVTKEEAETAEGAVASSPFDALDKSKLSANSGAPAASTEQSSAAAPEVPVSDNTLKKQAVLYCDSFAAKAAAETQKAKIAFSGVMSTVVQRDGTYKLKIGPFVSRDEAKKVFAKLGDASLVGTCSLVDE